MKQTQKLLALLMCLVMCVSMLPPAAFAEDSADFSAATEVEEPTAEPAALDEIPVSEPETEQADLTEEAELPAEDETVTNEAAFATSGTMDTGLTWTLSDEGVLTISGTGAMPDWKYNTSPWYSIKNTINTIVIDYGVTSIGANAFYDCTSSTSVSIPASVTSIGESAFSDCHLTSVEIPDSVTEIGTSAFHGCWKMTSVKLSANLTSLANSVFSRCSVLPGVEIPASVTSIGDSAFYECTALTEITVPAGVTSIGASAFYGCTALTDLTLNEGLNIIYRNAFYNCESLKSVTIPDSVTYVYESAFRNCTALTDLTIGTGINTIFAQTFMNCTSLLAVTIPANVTWIEQRAFSCCSSLASLTIEDGLKRIDEYAFECCRSLPAVVCPDSVTKIAYSAFQYCSSLATLHLPEKLSSIERETFKYCSSLPELTVPASVTDINANAFEECAALTDAYFRGNAPDIDGTAFTDDTLNGYYPAGNDTWTSSVLLDYGGDITWIADTQIHSVTLNAPVVNGGEDFPTVDDVTVSAGHCTVESVAWYQVTATGTEPATGTPVSGLTYTAVISLRSEDGFTFPDGEGSVTVTDSLTGTSYAFTRDANDETLLNASFTMTATELEIVASGTCGNDLTWTLDENGTLKITGSGAMTDWESSSATPWYSYRRQIITVKISGATNIGKVAFQTCTRLSAVTIPNTVTKIGANAFQNCDSLTVVTIPDSVTAIDSRAFYACAGLTGVTIPASVTSIGTSAFAYCLNMKAIEVSGSNLNYSSQNGVLFSKDKTALIQCPGAKTGEYDIPGSVKTIEASAFNGCKGLTAVTVPSGVTGIGRLAFANCTGLQSITFKGNAPTFGSDTVFYNDTALTAYYPAGNSTWTEDVMLQYGGTVTWTAYTPEQSISGDVDGDGSVTGKDVSVLKSCLANDTASDLEDTSGADANGDSVVNLLDLLIIKRLVAA